jgi:hypothetical protein
MDAVHPSLYLPGLIGRGLPRNTKMKTFNGNKLEAKETLTAKSVGYTVLQSGEDSGGDLCVLIPHVAAIKSAKLDAVARRIDVTAGAATFSLSDVPVSVMKAFLDFPQKVLFVTVDSLSRLRSSVRANQLS